MTYEEKLDLFYRRCAEHEHCNGCPVDRNICLKYILYNDHVTREEEFDILLSFFGETAKPNDIPEFVPDEQHDPVAHPAHYTHGGMECIDEMVVVFGKNAVMDFCLLNVWKYRKRAMYKNGEEDMKKADWYMAKYAELKESADD